MLSLMLTDETNRSLKLEKIYYLYKKDLYLTALSMVKNHEVAEDIVHTTIMRIDKHLEKIIDIESKRTRSYLITITKNLCRDYFNEDVVKGKHMKFEVPIEELVSLVDINNFVEEKILREEYIEEIAKNINKLNPSYADILKLRFYDENSIEEISKILGISKNNASVRLKRALIALKKLISKKGELNV